MTAQQLITDHLDIWTAAHKTRSTAGRGSNNKLNLHGIKKLRELILELAVRGKLVPQDANDEPASELLKKIAAEKAKLIKEGVIKKDRAFTEIKEHEKFYELPLGWEWAQLEDIGRDWGQKTPDDDFTYIDVSAIDNTLGEIVEPTILSAEDAPSRARKIVVKGTVIYSTIRPYLQNIAVIENNFSPEAIASTAFAILHPLLEMPAKYFSYYLRSPAFIRYVESVQTGIAYPAINDKQFYSGVVPIPPLPEQHRIVAKVDELMAFCDQLEQTQSDNIAAHAQLVEALLATLTNSGDHNELQNNWQRIAAHFNTLFTTEHSIDQLKQTILQLAVMGKLVPQNPNDEPASELLKKIAAEKAQLIKEGKIKNHPPVEPMGDQISLPDGWIEVVIQDFADVRLGSTPSRAEPKYWGGDILWVSSGEVANCIIMDTEEKITKEGFANSSTCTIPARSLLMAIIGQGKTRGQTALLGVEACTNQNVAAFVFNKSFVVPEFVWLWARSKYESHRGDGRGGAQPALNGKIVRSFRFPLPPFEEQQRIVAKVDELMTLCDTLKTNLQNAQTTQLALADALVEQAVG
jgi:type I restriction enzyme S subunit